MTHGARPIGRSQTAAPRYPARQRDEWQAARGPAYRWPLERFEKVARLILDSNLEVLVLGHGKAAPEASRLAAALGEDARFLGDSDDLFPFLEALAGSTALLANDGLLPHLAAHVGIPAAVTFGPGQAEARRPLGRMHRILDAHVECKACGKSKCPLDHRCMLEITVAQACEAVSGILARSQPAPVA